MCNWKVLVFWWYLKESFCRKFSCYFFQSGLATILFSRVYIWMRMKYMDEKRGRMYGTFIHCSAFAEAANRPYINVLYTNSLWSTDSRQIAFGCSLNVHRTAKCCLPYLGNTFTLNDGFIFASRIRVLFTFRFKPGFTHPAVPQQISRVLSSFLAHLRALEP